VKHSDAQKAQLELNFESTPLRISARTLGLLALPDACPGCFWLRTHLSERFPFQIPMPGVFSTIDAFSKKVIHSILDQEEAWPSWFPAFGVVKGYAKSLHYSWFHYHDPQTQILLSGTPDDILQVADGSYHITDYKTATFTDRQDQLLPLYDVQLNAYAFIAQRLMEREPLQPISGISLIFFEPLTGISASCISQEGPRMSFRVTPKPLKLRCDRLIPPLLSQAREIFDLKQLPAHLEGCRDQERLLHLLRLAR
jgi:hypothetical protein